MEDRPAVRLFGHWRSRPAHVVGRPRSTQSPADGSSPRAGGDQLRRRSSARRADKPFDQDVGEPGQGRSRGPPGRADGARAGGAGSARRCPEWSAAAGPAGRPAWWRRRSNRPGRNEASGRSPAGRMPARCTPPGVDQGLPVGRGRLPAEGPTDKADRRVEPRRAARASSARSAPQTTTPARPDR